MGESWEGAYYEPKRRCRGGFGADDDGALAVAIDAEACPVTALGHVKGQYWFFHGSARNANSLSASFARPKAWWTCSPAI